MTIRRDLAARNPAAYLTDLATSVSNLTGRLAGAGRRDEALVAAEEAVTIRRDLAARNPAAYLTDLAASVDNLANHLAEAGRQEEALRIFEVVGESLKPGARAELLIVRVAWRRSHDDQAAIDDLRDAAAAAEEEPDRGWAGRARRAVRAGAKAAGSSAELADLPTWATAELPESIMTMLKDWLAAADWAQQEEFLRTSNAELLTAEGRDALSLMTALYPELAELTNLSSILAEIASRGGDAVLAELGTVHGHLKLVQDWLATSTWTESQDFLAAHPELIADPRTVDVLRAYSGDPVIARHIAIVRLCQRMPLAEVYDLATDVSMAVDAAVDASDAGDRATLADIWAVAPNLSRTPFAGPYLAAVHIVLQDSLKRDAEEVNERIDTSRLMDIAAEQGTDAQRTAGSARLRRLARKQPSHAESLGRLAEILAAGPASSESQGTADTLRFSQQG